MKKKQDRLIIWAAKGMFKSAKKLAEALKPETNRKVLIVRSKSPRFKHKKSDVIVNWGNSHYPQWGNDINPINYPDGVAIAVNKLKTFQELQDKVNIPKWTTDYETAKQWEDEIISRNILNGFGGRGIGIHTNLDLPLDSLLYVKYKKKKKEFRVHVFNDEVIDVTQKKKRIDYEGDPNPKIRNYGNGWVYCREGIEIPEDLFEQAKKAIEAVGLTFGAVDIIWNERENKSYVLEINTAPGLEGTTIEAYKNAILNEI